MATPKGAAGRTGRRIKKTPDKASAAPTANGNSVRVRMYRVGFGDCFLVTLPNGGGPTHILVDCGVHSQGDIKTMARVIDDIARETQQRLAVVIATHAHQDHLSGFGSFEPQFRGFEIGEVWLPWTEDPHDSQAARYKKKQLALAEAVHLHLAALGANRPAASDTQKAAMHAILNVVGNGPALKLLKSGINGGKVRFLEAGDSLPKPDEPDIGGIKGLTVSVLGPPRDEKFLSRMNPPSGERFLRLGARGRSEVTNAVRPFNGNWRWTPGKAAIQHLAKPDLTRLEALTGDPEGLAFALDHAVNNSSLVTLFSCRGQHLLFPGDAQYGSWAYWIQGPDADDIFKKVTFLKVAHHGSHNATPKTALEKMEQGNFAAMVSTQSKPWDSIPKRELMKRLRERAKAVVQSDSLHVAGGPDGPRVDRLPTGFTRGAFWFDYTIPL